MTKCITRFYITDDDRRLKSVNSCDGTCTIEELDHENFTSQCAEMMADENLQCSFDVNGIFYKSCMTFINYQP